MNRVLEKRVLPTGQMLQIVEGDITEEATDAIVNAANAYLQHGGGLAGQIKKAGGPIIQEESNAWIDTWGCVSHERPAWTSGGNLHAKYVIHAVGPKWGDGDEAMKLSAAVRGSLEVADELHCESIALPALSTGVYGYPVRRAAKVITSAIREYFADTSSGINQVRIVLLDSGMSFEFLETWAAADWPA